MKDHIKNYFTESASVLQNTMDSQEVVESIQRAAQIMIDALKTGNKILTCGNGGSMCDAMHFASELTGKYKHHRDPIAAIALSDVAAMTCISNDFGYKFVYRRQIRALGNIGDALLAISTSGTSLNIIQAIIAARQRGMFVIGLTGERGFLKMGVHECAHVVIKVPTDVTNFAQEVHTKIIHVLVELVELNLNP